VLIARDRQNGRASERLQERARKRECARASDRGRERASHGVSRSVVSIFFDNFTFFVFSSVSTGLYVYVCVGGWLSRMCARACVRACARACVRVRVPAHICVFI